MWWGLPLDSAFFLPEPSAHHVVWFSDSCVRREATCLVRSSDGTATGCQFPSWLWVGWVGRVKYSKSWQRDLSFHLDLIFYYFDAKRLLRRVEASTGAVQSPVEMRVRKDGEKTIVTPEYIPEIVRASSIAWYILFFWSSTAQLLVRPEGDCPSLLLLSRNGHVGPMWTKKPSWFHSPSLSRYPEKELAEFVVIGMGTLDGSEEYFAVLMLTLEDEDGVVLRRGMVYIKVWDWVIGWSCSTQSGKWLVSAEHPPITARVCFSRSFHWSWFPGVCISSLAVETRGTTQSDIFLACVSGFLSSKQFQNWIPS